MRYLSLALFTALCSCGSASSTTPKSKEVAAAADAETRPDVLVRLSGAADVTRVGPGQEFTVAAVLEIEPGWHVHWENPGETGVRTEANIRAPAGFEVGALRYPGPTRFESRGAVSYGYETRAVLSARVTAPDSIGSESAVIVFEASWLACKEECVRGRASAKIELAPATADAPASPTNQALFQDHETRLPMPLDALANARHAWRSSRNGSELVIYVDGGARVEFYPERGTQMQLAGQALVPGVGVGALHLSFRTADPGPVRGVMFASDTRNSHYFAVEVPGPGADADAL